MSVLSCVQVEGCPLALERATTAALMCEHGYERVRGSSWCKVDMQKPPGWWDPEQVALSMRYGPRKSQGLDEFFKESEGAQYDSLAKKGPPHGAERESNVPESPTH